MYQDYRLNLTPTRHSCHSKYTIFQKLAIS
uniref:Uncharacterized protein n=1 Tax=Rhizophora mucronata TaxID=61149 RepID=A0A2P2ND36_RHIMU